MKKLYEYFPSYKSEEIVNARMTIPHEMEILIESTERGHTNMASVSKSVGISKTAISRRIKHEVRVVESFMNKQRLIAGVSINAPVSVIASAFCDSCIRGRIMHLCERNYINTVGEFLIFVLQGYDILQEQLPQVGSKGIEKIRSVLTSVKLV